MARPERVAGLVLWYSPYAGASEGWTATQRELQHPVLDMAADVLSEGLDFALARRAECEPGLNVAGVRSRWERHDPASLAAALRGLGWTQPFASADDLSAIDAPAAIQPGTDAMHPAHIGERYLAAMRNAVRIDGSAAAFANFVSTVV